MIDRIYTVLMVGLSLLGWLYIIAKAWGLVYRYRLSSVG